MGKKKKGGGEGGSVKKPAKSESVAPPRAPITLREEVTGKLKKKESTSIKSTLKVEHLKNLAVWAAREAHIPSLGAFYGHQLAAVSEAAGVPPDPSLFTCQRCEIVLYPGLNSTVRIEKNRSKVRHRRNKAVNSTQNNVVYKCHFCLHQNVKRGTPKGHIKGISTSKNKSLESTHATKSITQSKSSKSENKDIIKCDDKANHDVSTSQIVAKDVTLVDHPATPSSVSPTNLLEGKKRRRNNSSTSPCMSAAKSEASKTQGTGSKRRKRSWTSLKEQAQRNDLDNTNLANFTIPFLLK